MRTIALEPHARLGDSPSASSRVSDELLRVQQGSLYPALHRLEHQGWITAEWGASDNNRRARFYSLTRARPQADDDRGVEVGAPLGRRQPRAAADIADADLGTVSSRWCARIFLRGRREAELGEELRFHVDRETERLWPLESSRTMRDCRHVAPLAASRR
jgi:hypothetical protein